jgi:hypothetical protein
MPVKKDSIDIKASDCERFKKLKKIIENILEETDSSKSKDERKWILWQFLYIIWWESTRATTRKQTRGPARGLMQLEPATLWDMINNYILGSEARIKNLADAAGVSKEEMKKALEDFRDNNREPHHDGGKNSWPNAGDGKKLEEWLLTIDSFGIKLMRLYFKQFRNHRFPPKDGNHSNNPQDEKYKDEFAEGWAKWWKRYFKSEEQRKEDIEKFKERARELDELSKKCEEEDEEKEENKKSEDGKKGQAGSVKKTGHRKRGRPIKRKK